MFFNCTNLEYLNIQNFKLNLIEHDINLFNSTKINLVLCINNINYTLLLAQLGGCRIISCFDDWQNERNMINKENNTCIEKNKIINETEINEISYEPKESSILNLKKLLL